MSRFFCSTFSKASLYSAMGSYWDEHGLDECWDETSDASFEFVAESDSELLPCN